MPIQFISLGLALISTGQDAQLFNDSERASIVSYWSAPGRYAKSDFKNPRGPWVVRLTPEGSQWLWNYNKARGLSKTNPLTDPGALSSDQVEWEKWIDAKVAFDRYQAAVKASELNAKDLNVSPDAPSTDSVDDPGPMPQALNDLAGDAPSFAAPVKPTNYTISFDDGTTIQYKDAVDMRPRYAYYRATQGVQSAGAKLRIQSDEIARLCEMAGLSETERHVMAAVSPLEGGFDSVNTYDTGYVSVGFIQFACLQGGAGSLGAVLKREKDAKPDSFAADFRRFGIDVTDSGKLDCVDPVSGNEVVGTDAAKAIIEDKRLTAVFQRAGQKSDAFRVAQLQTAKSMYYPSEDLVPVSTPDGTVKCKVCDLVHSEAGMAILMDRKVNTGNLNPMPSIVAGVMQDAGLQSIEDLAAHELEIVQALILRKDFLSDPNLSQPTGARRAASKNSRHGDRKPRPKPKPKGDDGSSGGIDSGK